MIVIRLECSFCASELHEELEPYVLRCLGCGHVLRPDEDDEDDEEESE